MPVQDGQNSDRGHGLQWRSLYGLQASGLGVLGCGKPEQLPPTDARGGLVCLQVEVWLGLPVGLFLINSVARLFDPSSLLSLETSPHPRSRFNFTRLNRRHRANPRLKSIVSLISKPQYLHFLRGYLFRPCVRLCSLFPHLAVTTKAQHLQPAVPVQFNRMRLV